VTNQITDRELWLNALDHRYSGRFPSDIWIRPEPERALIEYYGAKDFERVQDILGITRMRDVSVSWANPQWETRSEWTITSPPTLWPGSMTA